MSNRPAIRGEALQKHLEGRSSPLWLGTILLLTIEVVAFGTLISAYFYLRFHAPAWPPHGAPFPALAFAGAATVTALLSSAAAALAGRALDGARRGPAVLGLLTAGLLALAVAALLTADRVVDPVGWDRDAYGSLLWVTVLIYALHGLVLATMAGMTAVLVRAGDIREGRRAVLDAVLLYWHGTVALWLPLFGVFYLLPRVL